MPESKKVVSRLFVRYFNKDNFGYVYVYEARSVGQEAVAWINSKNVPDRVREITELEYLAAFNGGIVSVDKSIISADGLDTATVTVKAHPDLAEIIFYHVDTDEPIATVSVNPTTHTTTLQVTATTPGVIRIRAGEPTMTRLNEVVIMAQ